MIHSENPAFAKESRIFPNLINCLKNKKKAIDISKKVGYTYVRNRGVAQFGRALRSGRRGRRFESCRLDLVPGPLVKRSRRRPLTP